MRVSTTNFQNAFGKYLKKAQEDDVIIVKNGRAVAKLIKYGDPIVNRVGESSSAYSVNHYVTYSEFLELTEASESRYELIDGQIYLLAAPNHHHQLAVREILVQMYSYFSDKSCSPHIAPYDIKLYNDAECFEDDPNVVQPDVFVMCDPEMVDDEGRYQGKPSLVVEVLSKSTQSKDMVKKLNLYMMSDIPEYWIFNPMTKQIMIYVFEDRKLVSLTMKFYGDLIESVTFEGLSVATEQL